MRFHRQPDGFSCGASCVVTARLLVDPDLAEAMTTTGQWEQAVRAEHRSLTGPRDTRGRWQVPWPRLLGTPPWTVARAMTRLTGVRYRWTLLRARTERSRAVLATASRERPVVVFVGSRLLPRHVVLVIDAGAEGAGTWVYNPGSGRVGQYPWQAWTTTPLGVGTWPRLWGAVAPVGPPGQASNAS